MKKLNWIYVMDKQPEHDEVIVRIDAPYEGHYTMGMVKYFQTCSWEEILQFQRDNDLPYYDWWWISAKDFPFPDKT